MSNNKAEKKKIVIGKGDKIIGKKIKNKSPFRKGKELPNLNKIELNNTSPIKEINYLGNATDKYFPEITEENEKKLLTSGNKAYISKINNTVNNYGISENAYIFPMSNRDISLLSDSSKVENNSNTSNTTISRKAKVKDNTSNKGDVYDSKYTVKINKIKDDYIDFLQKEFEDNTKKSVKLDSNNKELLKKCDDLMQDNRILSNTLNDRTSQLNKIIQENLMIKSQLDKSILNNQKNEQKLEYYEEQFNLFKTSNENYQNIIKELKDHNNQLNLNLDELEKTNDENLKNAEENFQIQLNEEIENTKKEMEEFYENKNLEESDKYETKIRNLMEQIKELEEKNEQLINELTNKDNIYDLVCKENEKLTNENNLFRSQVEQYAHQINELNTIIKHKDNLINNLKSENFNTDKFLNKSISNSILKLDGNEFINENISKLITDNEENKMRIELLNDKIKSIDEMEKKYNQIMTGTQNLPLSQKLAYQKASPKNISTHFNYNNSLNDIKNSGNKYIKNYTYNSFVSPKKLEDKLNYKTKGNNVVLYSTNITKDNKRKKFKDSKYENKSVNRINIEREIKVSKKLSTIPDRDEDNAINRTRKIEIKTAPNKGKYYRKIEVNKKKEPDEKQILITHGKELEVEKDEVKESIREMNRKKNYTYKPKIMTHFIEENKQINDERLLTAIGHSPINKIDEERNMEQNNFYLYGIDRNDILHTFNINEKKWCDMRKIADLNDNSNTFKKDYQYEGTLLYNTLNGVYILTGEKTDTLYYFNSQTNSISKICKFNNCHDNGSLMFDTNNNCLYVFGGKKINSCEYYSFNDKKVYKLPDLVTDRANASFIVSNNKIYGFFGFSYSKNNYAKNIEYMDYYKKDKWYELNNIKFLKQDINFDTESVSTMYYRQNQSQILIYCGIQGEEEDFVTEYYLLYDSRNNTIDKINKWNVQQFKGMGKKWKNYNFKSNDPKGFHFAKDTRFLSLPRENEYEGYNERDPIDIMIDYKNNVHYIIQDKQKIDIYRSDM